MSKRRARREWVQNLARPQVREGLAVRDVATVTGDPGGDVVAAELFIYDYIDSWGGDWGVSASMVLTALAQIPGRALNVRLNSPGGEYFEGVAIANALRSHDGPVNVYIDGMAASAASVIAMAGETVTMGIGSQLMIHDASTITWGNPAEHRRALDMLDQTSDDIAAQYAAKAGGDVKDWRAAMVAETWYTAAQAVAAGLADVVAGAPLAEEGDDESCDCGEDSCDECSGQDESAGERPAPYKAEAGTNDVALAAMFAELRAELIAAVAVSRETPAPTTPDPLPAPADEAPSAALPDAEFTPELIRSAFRKVTT
jgi:ATP-dependent protease ClpP protease subunit